MSGYTCGQHQPVEKCPYCGSFCDADFVDIGVGYQQCGPYHCLSCGASEIGPYDAERKLSAKEERCGWYGPDQPPGSSANVIDGKIVTHQVMVAAYREEFVGNPLWQDDSYVKEWYRKTRGIGG